MKKLFKDGKVFGKYNLIDFLVVVIVTLGLLVGLGSIGIKLYNNFSDAGKEEIIMKFYTEEVSDFVADKLEIGTPLMDADKTIELGVATDIEINNSVTYGGITGGQYELVNKEGYKSAIITTEVKGVKNDLGAIIDNFQYGVGHSMTLRVGDAKIWLRVYDIALKSEMEKNEKKEADKQKPILISFEANEVNNIAVNAIEAGDELYDSTNGVALGKIVSYEVSDAKVFITTDDGRLVTSAKEGHSTVKLVAEVSGELLENGTAAIGNKDYFLAKDLHLRAGNAVIGYSIITDITLK